MTVITELESGKSVTIYTAGISMQPLLYERKTHVVIEPVRQVKKGDILLYVRENGEIVLHRLIKQDASHYFMRGDNTYSLEAIDKSQAKGIVTHIYRKGKLFGVKSLCYRLYVHIWNMLYPVRYALAVAKVKIKKKP